jgi:hypothetical protein
MTAPKERLQIFRHSNKGRVVIAVDVFVAYELVCVGRPRGRIDARDSYSFQIDDQRHVHLDEPAEVLSHSCAPNLYVKNNYFGGYNFYARRRINSGEELSWHYGTTESESVAVANCHCGTDCCQGRSVGFKEASPDLRNKLYRLGVADYLRSWFEKQGGQR